MASNMASKLLHRNYKIYLFILIMIGGIFTLLDYERDYTNFLEDVRKETLLLANLQDMGKVEHYASITGAYILYLKNGKVAYYSKPYTGEEIINENYPEYKRALQGQLGEDIRPSLLNNERSFFCAAPIYEGNRITGVVRLEKMIEYRLIFNKFLGYFILGASIILLLGKNDQKYYKRFLFEPLKRATEITSEIRNGNYNKRILYVEQDELGELIEEINGLTTNVKEQVVQLSFAKERLEAILNYMTSGILLVNAKGEVLLTNPSLEKIFHLEAKKIVGKNNLEVIRNYELDERVKEALQANQVVRSELMIHYPEEKYVQAYFVPIKDSSKEKSVLVIIHDITAIKETETIKSEFVANASHELRSPLTAIKGFAETLLDGAINNPDMRLKFVSIINQESERLIRIVQDLLDLSKIESKQIKLMYREFKLRPLLSEIELEFSQRIFEQRYDFKVELTEQIEMIEADRDWLHQVLYNLLDNAVKYTPPGGSITIKIEQVKKSLLFKVIDTGIGIPREDLSRIFERFYRVDKARSRKMGGTGLGLSIVKHVVEKHGGKIGINSEAGKGTEVWFKIPKERRI
jgi:two-component system phosphate regulon sensor histidine kinase PhoR